MDFWYFFRHVFLSHPWKALVALYWHITGRKLRARNQLRAMAANASFVYDLWINKVEHTKQLAAISEEAVANWEFFPKFCLILELLESSTQLDVERTIASVKSQLYSEWTLVLPHSDHVLIAQEDDPRVHAIPSKAGASRGCFAELVAAADGDYMIPIRAGDMLSEMALFRFAEALQIHRVAAILYGDQDEIDESGRRANPWFKPEWNPEMFFAYDYLSSAVAMDVRRARAAVRNSSSKSLHGLLLTATEAARDAIVHVPYIVVHSSTAVGSDQLARMEAVALHLRSRGATCSAGPFDTVKITWPLPSGSPLATIIIPTKDKADLLRTCVDTVLRNTDYSNFEMLVIDNASTERQAVQYLREIDNNPRVRVLSYLESYNFSAINNFAVAHARGSHICLLNNDTEIVNAGWLTEMMRYAVRPDVGAVGAKLLYSNGTIQHAGVVIGIGEAAGHAHRFLPADQPGYFRQPHVTQFVSAVTAACLVIEKSKYTAVGGLDEGFAVAFNDVDFCLKIEAAGWRNVYVPHAVLVHHESQSRGKDSSRRNIDRFRRELQMLQDKWAIKSYQDPLHNPNLDRGTETFTIAV